ncbi:Gfo/Idh/MocA family protein [Streptacidiphilus sp. P02-A3a]|uniref:Gfo/Idh/MocA family protein n=1 Tax=Streptacidiphilus sp. P02-A3a TaxID=2704468 RepID=UPI0015FE1222|nr:Gfo/Idh/MocA family oxidoreductase [Streptacidiphilus sp. P02-A3a]QMU71895.1 Gfo/Idh/MocA family oxidoreductase [Streptacidiphilus sp. P02-A3a]
MTQLRIGVLGAARIAPSALVRPAARLPEVVVGAVAARDPERARRFAAKHGIGTVHHDYQALLDDPDLDAVYNPLPNGLHAQWTLRALAAGKHVLCEKPFTANATEARAVADAAAASGLVAMEAFHYRYHPMAARMREIVDSGELGEIRSVRTAMCFPLPVFGDIRYSYPLGGGAMMDGGCYALHLLRLLAGEAAGGPPEVLSARAVLRAPEVDRAMTAELRFPNGASGALTASLWSRRLLDFGATVRGDRGELRVVNYLAPQLWNRLTVRTRGGVRRERVHGGPTYGYQLRAFAEAVLRGGPVLTPAADAVVTMGLIDDIYRAAGLRPRGNPAQVG